MDGGITPQPARIDNAGVTALAMVLQGNPTLIPELIEQLDGETRKALAQTAAESIRDAHVSTATMHSAKRRAIAVAEVASAMGVTKTAALKAVDKNQDGEVSAEELGAWLRSQTFKGSSGPKVNEGPSREQLMQVAILAGVPFIGFGAVDNGVMILAGDAIDNSLGVYLGLSTLAAAGLGNLVSNLLGIGTGGLVEDAVRKLGIQDPGLSPAQSRMRSTKLVTLAATAVGLTIGCTLGLGVLFFKSDEKEEAQPA